MDGGVVNGEEAQGGVSGVGDDESVVEQVSWGGVVELSVSSSWSKCLVTVSFPVGVMVVKVSVVVASRRAGVSSLPDKAWPVAVLVAPSRSISRWVTVWAGVVQVMLAPGARVVVASWHQAWSRPSMGSVMVRLRRVPAPSLVRVMV
ncbi:Uncharacterised protein [Dermatophilus congolensis]|uniref:Uncharacterized protein n=1 Tax=Dermatophilus congolensis TaxID=1863 RepID=A0AA46BPY1_9MICO|nr:Uncharacterised protein [Dermatophilus congolensis]